MEAATDTEHINNRITTLKLTAPEATGVRGGGLRTVKPVLSGHSERRPKIGFQDQLSLSGQKKYCRMLQGEHSAILLTFIKLPYVIKIFVLSICEWPLKTDFTEYFNGQIFTQDSADGKT